MTQALLTTAGEVVTLTSKEEEILLALRKLSWGTIQVIVERDQPVRIVVSESTILS